MKVGKERDVRFPKRAESYHEENSRRREQLGNDRGSTRIAADRTISIQDDFAWIRVVPRKSAVKPPVYFLAGAGHSGWQTPTGPPPGPKQQPHGRLQMSPVMHELPHALIACVPVRNWCSDIALAERTPINIVANKTLLAIVRSPFFDQFSLPVEAVGRRAGKSLRCRKGYSKSTALRR